MNLTNCSAKTGFTGSVRSSQTAANGSTRIGLGDRIVSYTGCDILGAYKVTAAANGNAATHTLATGAVAQTTGLPVIADGDGKDVEGVSFPSLVKIMALRITATGTNTGTVAVTGASSGVLPAVTLAAGVSILIAFPVTGATLNAATLIHTLSTAGDSVTVEFLGKSS